MLFSSDEPICTSPTRAPCRGFNLIETTIVLAVVGLVIGGIWVAAATVSYQMKLNKTAEGILRIIQTTRLLYKNTPCPGTNTWLDPMTINLGVPDWPDYPAGGATAVQTPLGPPIVISIQCTSAYGEAINIGLGIGTWDFSYSMCQALTAKLGFKRTAGGFPIPDNEFYAMGGAGHCIPGGTSMGYYWKYLP